MLNAKPNVLQAAVKLKTGELLKNIALPEDYAVNAEDLTEKTVHKFVTSDHTRGYFVQGSNIAYLEIEG